MQNFAGTCAARKVHTDKLDAAQKLKPNVGCEDGKLINCFRFKYLGSIFAADGSEIYDVQRRINLATARMGDLRHVFNSSIRFGVKMKIYKTAI